MIKKIFAAISILCSFPGIVLALEEPQVAIQKVEDRTQAVVSSMATTNQPEKKGLLTEIFSPIEKGIVGTASTSSHWAGKGADGVVKAVQTTGGLLFTPLFRALDVVNWGGKKGTDKDSSGR